jgi:hypothetical protein
MLDTKLHNPTPSITLIHSQTSSREGTTPNVADPKLIPATAGATGSGAIATAAVSNSRFSSQSCSTLAIQEPVGLSDAHAPAGPDLGEEQEGASLKSYHASN